MRSMLCATVFTLFLLTGLPAWANDSEKPKRGLKAPEFLPSIQWEKGTPQLSMAGMRGKMVVIVFFQSWCPICNGWSPGVFSQLEEAYGDDSSVILIALKTDSGAATSATNYLKKSKADVSKWYIGADPQAKYYINFTGADSLFWYTVIDQNGMVKTIDYAGKIPPNKGYAKRFAKLAEKRSPLLKGTDYDPKFAPIQRMIEAGDYAMAVKSLRSAPRNLREQATAMRDEMYANLKTEAEALALILDKEESSSQDKYMAWVRLEEIAKLRRTDPGTVASDTIKKHRKDDWLKDEVKAQKAYEKIVSIASKHSGKQFAAKLEELLPQLSDKYGETTYGFMATVQTGLMAKMRNKK